MNCRALKTALGATAVPRRGKGAAPLFPAPLFPQWSPASLRSDRGDLPRQPVITHPRRKRLTDADHFAMMRNAQRRFAPTVIGITRNGDRHQIGMSDRHRRNTQLKEFNFHPIGSMARVPARAIAVYG